MTGIRALDLQCSCVITLTTIPPMWLLEKRKCSSSELGVSNDNIGLISMSQDLPPLPHVHSIII